MAQQRGARKAAAISAGVAVLALGATYTLASWNDSEWVWGGTDGGDGGVATSTFQVQQNIDITDPDGWADFHANPGQALVFTAGALNLSLGDSIYAPVSLRTIAGSEAGTVVLQGAVPALDGDSNPIGNDPDNALWDAIEVTVYTSSDAVPPACNAAEEDDWNDPIAGLDGAPLGTVAGATQLLPAGADELTPGAPQHYCFKLTLPATASNDLQGRSIAPAWEFAGLSD